MTTEGIIQRVFRKYQTDTSTSINGYVYAEGLQQELIAEIKKEIMNMTLIHKCTISELHPYNILENIIGSEADT